MKDLPAVDNRPEHLEGEANVGQDNHHDRVDDQPGIVLEDDVLHLVAGGQSSIGYAVLLLCLDLCVDDLDPLGNLADDDSMETDSEDELVVPLREYFLVEQEVEDDPEKSHTSIEGDGVVPENDANEADRAKFEDAVKEIPNILICYHVTGRFDYVLHVVAKNLEQLGILVKERIASMPGVGKTETFLVFSEIKNKNGFPLDETEEV